MIKTNQCVLMQAPDFKFKKRRDILTANFAFFTSKLASDLHYRCLVFTDVKVRL